MLERKAVSTLMLTLLSISMLSSAFHVLPLKAVTITVPDDCPIIQTITGVSPPASGTWNINQNTVVTDENIIINGSIIVRSWCYLKLVRSTLRMNLVSDGQYGIYVEPSGAINMADNSKVLNYTLSCYYFYVKGHAYFDNFEIQGVGYGTAGPENESLYLYSSSNILTNGDLSNGKGAGLYLLQGNNVVTNMTVHDISETLWVGLAFWLGTRSITNDNTFTDVTAYNCWVGFNEDGHRNKLIRGTFYNCTGYGVQSYGDSFYAEDIVVHDSEYGIQASGTGVTAYGENSVFKDLTCYNLHVDALNVNQWARNITMESFTAYNVGGPVFGIGQVKYHYGSEPHNITVKNGIGHDSGYYGGEPPPVLGGVGFFENVSDVTVRNVEIYNSRVGISFRAGSNPIGYFSNINIIDCYFHNRANESDVYVNWDTMLTNVYFINTDYSNLIYNGGGNITYLSQNPEQPRFGQTVKVSANVIESVSASGVRNATLYYRVNNNPWHSMPMVFNEQSKLWETIIPSQQVHCLVDYYIVAQDYAGNENTTWTLSYTVALQGDANLDHIVDVVDAACISAHWYQGPPIGPLGYDLFYDLNSDGYINIVDSAIVNADWEKAW